MVVYCGGCSLVLDEDPNAELGTRSQCPECGARGRYMRTIPNSGHIIASSTVRKKAWREAFTCRGKTRRHPLVG